MSMNQQSKHLVFCDQYGSVGGGQTVLLSAVKIAAKYFEKITVVIPRSGSLWRLFEEGIGDSVTLVETDEIPLNNVNKTLVDYIRMIFATLKFSIKHRRLIRGASLVYANGPRQFPAILFLSLWTKTPAIYHVHLIHGRVERELIAIVARSNRTKMVVANSGTTARRLKAALFFSKEISNRRLKIIENGLSQEFTRLSYQDKFHKNPKSIHIAVIGTIRPEKRQEIVVAAARNFPDIVFHIVGKVDADSRAYFERLRGVAGDNVSFHSECSNIAGFLGSDEIKICIVPSRFESFGLVAIEAMACSCITLVSNCEALKDIATKTGAIVFGREPKELIEVLDKILRTRAEGLQVIARRQFDRTMMIYGSDNFERQFSRTIIDAVESVPET